MSITYRCLEVPCRPRRPNGVKQRSCRALSSICLAWCNAQVKKESPEFRACRVSGYARTLVTLESPYTYSFRYVLSMAAFCAARCNRFVLLNETSAHSACVARQLWVQLWLGVGLRTLNTPLEIVPADKRDRLNGCTWHDICEAAVGLHVRKPWLSYCPHL